MNKNEAVIQDVTNGWQARGYTGGVAAAGADGSVEAEPVKDAIVEMARASFSKPAQYVKRVK